MPRKPRPPRVGGPDTRTPHLAWAYAEAGRSLSEPTHRNPVIGGAEVRVGPRHYHAELCRDPHGRAWTRAKAPANALPAIHGLLLYVFAEDLGAERGATP